MTFDLNLIPPLDGHYSTMFRRKSQDRGKQGKKWHEERDLSAYARFISFYFSEPTRDLLARRDFPRAIASAGSRIRHEIIANEVFAARCWISRISRGEWFFDSRSPPFHRRLSPLASNYFPLRASGISTVTPERQRERERERERERRVEHERETSSYRAWPCKVCAFVERDEFRETWTLRSSRRIATRIGKLQIIRGTRQTARSYHFFFLSSFRCNGRKSPVVFDSREANPLTRESNEFPVRSKFKHHRSVTD